MNEDVKQKTVNLEDLNAHSKVLFNKGVGNRGTCTTASATAAKEVTFGTTFSLTDGATALVRFTYGISAENTTLAVTYTDSSGSSVTTDAKAIYYRGAALPAGLVQPKDTLLIKYNGTQWDVVGELDTTYESKAAASGGSDVSLVTTGEKAVWNAKQDALGAGTAQLLTTGTDTAERTWQAKIIADYVKANGNNLLDLMALSHDYVFKKRDCIAIDAALYRCTAETTEEPPFDFVFDANNSIVVDRINGYDSPVVDNDTLNAGWEKVVEMNDRYYVEQSKKEAIETSEAYADGINSALKTELIGKYTRTRLTDFSLSDLKKAVAEQNLEKYGLKVGDYKTINGHTYVIAGLNAMKGTHSYTCTSNHVGLIVIPHTTQVWNASGNTYTGADNRGAGYKNSDLHYYLKNTLLPLVETDLGAANLLAHYKLLSNAVNQNGINRYGEATGCSSDWAWESNCKICALSEVQVYGSTVWSSSGHDTGEACQQLEVFRHYNMNEIFGSEYPWLRDVVSASNAAIVNNFGNANYNAASYAYYVAALILFH